MKPRIIAIAILMVSLVMPAVFGQPDEKGKGRRPNGDRPGAGERPGDRARDRFSGSGPNAGPFGGLGGPGMLIRIMPVMMALDADQDGTLSESEIANASKALLRLDKNGDGVLSEEELRPDPSKLPGPMGGGPEGGPPSGAMAMRMFEARDKNRDGKLSGDEIPEMLKNRLSMIDKDGDGSIEKSEMERAAELMNDRAKQRPGRGGGSDGGGVKPKRPE